MASISSLGVGSGLDIQGLVTKLMEAEGASKTARLNRQEAEYQAKLSLYGTVKGALSDFQSTFSKLRLTSSFNSYVASSSDSKVFTATAKSGADQANYDVEVNQLAQSQKLTSGAIADKNSTSLGTGTLVIKFGTYTYDGAGAVTAFTPDANTSAKEIEITDGTLEGIRDSINNAGIGVKASIIKDPASGYKLIMTSETGEQNALNITVKAGTDSDGNESDNSGLSQIAYDPTAATPLNYLTESQKALSANATIDGVAIVSESNTISDVIDRVTIELKGESTSAATLSISQDTASIKEAVQSFVDGYNELMKTLNSASFYDKDTGNSGILIGDATVRGIVSQIRNVLNTTVNDPLSQYNSFASIGILTARDGSLEYDSSKLDVALAAKPDEIKHLLAGGKATTTSAQFSIDSITDNIGDGTYPVVVDGTLGSYTGASYFNPSTSLDFSAGVNFKINVNGTESGIIALTTDYTQGGAKSASQALTTFLSDLKAKINADSTLAGAKASVSITAEPHATDGTYRLILRSNKVGLGSSVTVTQDAAQVGLTAAGSSVAGTGNGDMTIGGEPATLKDGVLTGSGLYAGFQLRLADTFTGDLFTSIKVSKGTISALDNLINSFLDSGGLLSAKTDGLNASINDLGKKREELSDRLGKIEERYIKQFSAMDTLVAQLNSTSSYLENQLASLPAANKK